MTKVKDKTNKNSTEIKLGLLSFLAIIIYVILPQFEIIPFQIVNINIKLERKEYLSMKHG